VNKRYLHFSTTFALCLIILLSACKDSYTKVQKSTDIAYKYRMAVQYYNKGKYFQALPILEELIPLYKGRPEAEDLYFYYANAEYEQKNYIIAAYHFKRYTEIYPQNKNTEEALFRWADSYKRQSNEFDLEQDQTTKGIEAYQAFINTYPTSKHMPECNEAIKKLRRKLEMKSLSVADLYYKTENYRAAAIYYLLTIKEFPDIEEGEKLQFMVVKSYFKFAQLSILTKKPDRYKEVIKAYENFADRFKESKYLEEAGKYYESAKFELIRSTYEWASLAKNEEKERIFMEAIRSFNNYGPFIKDEKAKLQARLIMEESHYEIVRTNYQIAQNASGADKEQKLQQTIKSYQNFIDNFAGSKYAKDAEKIYLAAQESLKKLK
jgi:outer membrane protein assembly factor BamD